MVPLRAAALRAPLPRTTVSRWEEAPLVLLPILVTVSQSSMVGVGEGKVGERGCWFDGLLWVRCMVCFENEEVDGVVGVSVGEDE